METRSDLVALPVRIEVATPGRFERVQVLLRALVLVAILALFQSGLTLGLLAWLGLPLVAAVLIDRRGPGGYLERDAPRLLDALEWFVGFCAYMLFVTDRLPLSSGDRPLRLHVRTSGEPTVRSALVRLATSLPHFALIAFMSIISAMVACVAAVMVVFTDRYPDSLRAFQEDIVAWIARLLVYHASLVATFPSRHSAPEAATQQQPPLETPHEA